jgi:hypothetical protein
MNSKRICTLFGAILTGSVTFALPVAVRAGSVVWICQGDGEWDSVGCWAGDAPLPGNGLNVWVGGSNTTVFLLNRAYPPSMLQVGELSIGGGYGFPSTLSVDLGSSQTLVCDWGLVGNGGDGRLVLSSGTILLQSTNMAVLGVPNVGSSGTLLVNGGQLVMTNQTLFIGGGGTGQVTVAGGTVMASAVNVGNQGTLTVAGGALTVSASPALMVAETTSETGTVWLTGGQTALTGTLWLGYGGAGQMTVSNGLAVLGGGLKIGGYGVGQFTLAGGTVQVIDDVDVARYSGSQGTLTIAGGTMVVSGNLSIPEAGTQGTVWVNGGLLVVTNANMSINGGHGFGQMTVSNGVVLAREIRLGTDPVFPKVLTLVGGTIRVLESIYVGYTNWGSGTLTVAGGTMTATNLLLGNYDCSSTGVVVMAGGSLFVTNNTHSAVLEVRSGTLLVNNGTLVVDRLVATNSCAHFQQIGGTLVVGGVTNPFFRVTSINLEGSNVRVTWQTLGGETNILQATNGGPGGSYNTNFVDLPPQIIVAAVGLTTTNSIDVGGATNRPARYYRVRLVP